MVSQKDRHLLDGNRVNFHVGDISCQIDVTLKIALVFVGVRYVSPVREGTLYESTSATDGINAKF